MTYHRVNSFIKLRSDRQIENSEAPERLRINFKYKLNNEFVLEEEGGPREELYYLLHSVDFLTNLRPLKPQGRGNGTIGLGHQTTCMRARHGYPLSYCPIISPFTPRV